MAGFMCDIVTPRARLVSEEATLVVVPGVEGEMGFLRGHAPLVSVLADGVARLTLADTKEVARYVLQGGYVEVGGDKVIVLADRALPVSDVDAAAVRDELAGIEADLASMAEEEIARTTLHADKAWCEVRLKAVQAA